MVFALTEEGIDKLVRGCVIGVWDTKPGRKNTMTMTTTPLTEILHERGSTGNQAILFESIRMVS